MPIERIHIDPERERKHIHVDAAVNLCAACGHGREAHSEDDCSGKLLGDPCMDTLTPGVCPCDSFVERNKRQVTEALLAAKDETDKIAARGEKRHLKPNEVHAHNRALWKGEQLLSHFNCYYPSE